MGIVVVTNVLGNLATNCYTVVNTDTRQAVIIDPAANADFLINMVNNQNYILEGILLTHGHMDHIGAVGELVEAFPQTKIYCSEDEVNVLSDSRVNLSTMFGANLSYNADVTLTDNQSIDLIGTNMLCIKTPGHTEGGMCYYIENENMLFSGDTLFEESVGRSDFPTGSEVTLLKSIKEKLFILPDSVVVYPGHGDRTTISNEKKYNPFVGGIE